MIDKKVCCGCKDPKSHKEFYASARTEDGLNRYCISCCKVNRSLEGVRKRDKRSKMSFRQRFRAKNLGLECDDSITLAGVFKRAFGICAVCNLWVQPRHASMDHTFPLSRGGTHTWKNVQLTHLRCNLKKGAKTNGH